MQKKHLDRRELLGILGLSVSSAVPGQDTGSGTGPKTRGRARGGRHAFEPGQSSDVSSEIAGDDALAFRKHTLDLGASEAACVVDLNGNGRLDVVSGENWYEQLPPQPGRGPRFIKHKFRDLPFMANYIEDLSDLAIDVNHDGYPDIVTCSYWSKPLSWWENPGDPRKPWREHVMVQDGSGVEFVFLVDILNTGKPLQLLPQFGNPRFPLAWYELADKGAANPWIQHVISPKSYGHGIGAGDVNGDGRTDVITPKGWFEAAADPRNGEWVFHPEFDLGSTGFIYTEDVNRDGVPDLVTSLGHDYGIFWMKQKIGAGGKRTWVKHMFDKVWSQSHAMTLADLNGDGRRELITGKRFWSHESDPGANEPLGVYWYEALDTKYGLQWKRHIIDYGTRAGGGIEIPVVDIDGDGDLDIIVAGRSGLFLFENLGKSA